jgi:hypothetical protein
MVYVGNRAGVHLQTCMWTKRTRNRLQAPSIEAVAQAARAAGASTPYWLTHESKVARVLYDRVGRNLGSFSTRTIRSLIPPLRRPSYTAGTAFRIISGE